MPSDKNKYSDLVNIVKGGFMNGTWIEVFRGGRQTDSAGTERSWTEADLDHAVQNFNPAKHEPPVVIGHPKENLPAYGWVDGLKRQGLTLLARFKQVAPEFSQMVQEGRFKKRSVSFYPDGTLRHVGFLGAMPPAVKGLKDIAFGEEEIAVYEYEEGTPTPPLHQEEESMTLEEALRDNERLRGQVATLEREKQDAVTKQGEFAEKVTAAEARATKAEKELGDLRTTTVKERETRINGEIAEFVDSLVKEGRVAPGEKDAKVKQLTAAAQVQKYEFAEGGEDTFGALKAAFKSLPVRAELLDFSEQYPRGGGEQGGKIDSAKIMSKI
jgi:hypothetical protein